MRDVLQGDTIERINLTKEDAPWGFRARSWSGDELRRIESYYVGDDGALERITYRSPGGNLLYDYRFEKSDDGLIITRQLPEEGLTMYRMVITGQDENGRILSADQIDEQGEQFGKIYAGRDTGGTLLRECNELYGGKARQVTCCDHLGRWTRRDHFMDDELAMTEHFYR